jgi:hypothetical protein
MLNFTYEDHIKIKNKHVAGISRTFYLSTETISRPPQCRVFSFLAILKPIFLKRKNQKGQDRKQAKPRTCKTTKSNPY